MLLAYHLQKLPYVFPLVGGNKNAQLHGNIDSLKIALTDEHIKSIEAVAPFDPGFPHLYIVCFPVTSSKPHAFEDRMSQLYADDGHLTGRRVDPEHQQPRRHCH